MSLPFPIEVDLIQPMMLNQKLCLSLEDDLEEGGKIIIWMFDDMVEKRVVYIFERLEKFVKK